MPLCDTINIFFNFNNISNLIFQTLKELSIPLSQVQCVLHKHELLICGGSGQRACYSYDTIKNEYKFICEYPSDAELVGHCIVKLVDNNNNKDTNQITLLSFGGDKDSRHTLIMKYVNNHNHPIIIGRDIDDYGGVRAMTGGGNNHLLFITYYPKNISVFDLNTFQFIKHDTIPTYDNIWYHCFRMKKKNKRNCQMLLFCKNTGLSIEYDEDNNTFQFYKLPFYAYAYVHINDIILFFGESKEILSRIVSKSVFKYSIRENKWVTFQNTLPSPLYYCVTILSEKDNHIHIIGGRDYKHASVSTHIKTKVRVLDPSQLVMICLF
ncbi:hypothetical protein RFI_31042 [Reticulomyxa filosa]|uniref:Uncharacterized protein n=1 Tax=Reticulomyxa filosa TaxID=46433 RepID=X6LWQ0_RETFI|nr:hypothetical protein RFI_31042 [Reticulomyxa filosa]|eukprot:ETO06353.1 hypothetical protein RFI_31042 [Reticulomyxa filosa]